MDMHNDVDGLQRLLKRRYYQLRSIPAKRMMPSDALEKLGSAIYGDDWLGHEVYLVEPDRHAGFFVNEAWRRRKMTVQIMVELLETEIARALVFDPENGSEFEPDISTLRGPTGKTALDTGIFQIPSERRRIYPHLLFIEQESLKTALANLSLSRSADDQDTESGPHHKDRMNLPPQPTYSEVLKFIELQYVDEGFNYLRDGLTDALMIRKLVARGHRRHRSANAGDRRLVLGKGLDPVDPLVWGESVPQGIGQFLQDPAGDVNEGWLNVSLVRAEVIAWLKAEVDENPHLRRLKRTASRTAGKRNALDAEKECRQWLENEMRKNGKLMEKAGRKENYRRDATEQFGIALRQFNRAWDNAIEETGAEHWREAGRPPKGRQKIDSPKSIQQKKS